MTAYVFDVDGVLADTRDAVRQAYSAAGVEMPDSAWGRSWHEWLPDLVGSTEKAQEIHAEKTAHYQRSDEIRRLPGADVYEELIRSERLGLRNIHVVTSASQEAVWHVFDVCHITHPYPRNLYTSVKQMAKPEIIDRLASSGVVIDDHDIGRLDAGWHVVRYREGMTAEELREAIRSWTA